jgi:hypothetical protein
MTLSFRKLLIVKLPALQSMIVEAIAPSFAYDNHPKEKPRTHVSPHQILNSLIHSARLVTVKLQGLSVNLSLQLWMQFLLEVKVNVLQNAANVLMYQWPGKSVRGIIPV